MVNYKKKAYSYAKKAAITARRAIQNRYIYKKSGYTPKIQTIARDLYVLKKMVNAEKKRLKVTQSTLQTVGQVNNNNSGHFLLDLTPPIAQNGNTYNGRSGNSVKWVSSFLDFNFQSQSSHQQETIITFHIVEVIGQPYSTMTDILGKYIQGNSFTSGSIYDSYGDRDVDYFKNFRVLKKQNVKIDSDTVSSLQISKRIRIPLKFNNRHIRWSLDTSSVSEGQVFLLITCNNGNAGGSASTVTNVYPTSSNSGFNFVYEFNHYYFDN